MVDSHPGHDTELAQEHVVWELNHAHGHAPTQDLHMVEKGVRELPNHHANAVSDIVQVKFLYNQSTKYNPRALLTQFLFNSSFEMFLDNLSSFVFPESSFENTRIKVL